jgi:hypothetical protein
MLPAFNSLGLLPEGIHPSDLDELQTRFAIFDRSDRRMRLFERFRQLVDEARKSSIVRRIFIGGSFVTAKSEPNDYDCILVIEPAIVGATLRPFEYNLVSRRMARRLFGGDIIPALEDSEALRQYLKFFQTTRDGENVGIVEIRL